MTDREKAIAELLESLKDSKNTEELYNNDRSDNKSATKKVFDKFKIKDIVLVSQT